jgi:hypothetical protein
MGLIWDICVSRATDSSQMRPVFPRGHFAGSWAPCPLPQCISFINMSFPCEERRLQHSYARTRKGLSMMGLDTVGKRSPRISIDYPIQYGLADRIMPLTYPSPAGVEPQKWHQQDQGEPFQNLLVEPSAICCTIIDFCRANTYIPCCTPPSPLAI